MFVPEIHANLSCCSAALVGYRCPFVFCHYVGLENNIRFAKIWDCYAQISDKTSTSDNFSISQQQQELNRHH